MENFAFNKKQKLLQVLKNIKSKMDLGINLTAEESRLICEVERIDRLKLKMDFKSEDGKFHIIRTGDAEPVMDHVKHLSEMQDNVPSHKRSKRFLGSIDPITAAQFRKEVGAGVGTQEFQEYALKKLDTTHTRFKVK